MTSKKVLYTILTSLTILTMMTASVSGVFINQAKAIPADSISEKIPGPVIPPTPEYTSDQLSVFKSDAMKIPGISSWSNSWKVNYVDFVGTTDPTPKWQKMMVHLYTSPTDNAKKACDIGWDAIVVVDLDTNRIIDSVYPTDNTDCHGAVVKLGDPDMIEQKVESVFPTQLVQLQHQTVIQRQHSMMSSILRTPSKVAWHISKHPRLVAHIATWMDL